MNLMMIWTNQYARIAPDLARVAVVKVAVAKAMAVVDMTAADMAAADMAAAVPVMAATVAVAVIQVMEVMAAATQIAIQVSPFRVYQFQLFLAIPTLLVIQVIFLVARLISVAHVNVIDKSLLLKVEGFYLLHSTIGN